MKWPLQCSRLDVFVGIQAAPLVIGPFPWSSRCSMRAGDRSPPPHTSGHARPRGPSSVITSTAAGQHVSPGLPSRSRSRSRSRSLPESVVLTGIGVGVGVGKFSLTPTPARSRSLSQHFFYISLPAQDGNRDGNRTLRAHCRQLMVCRVRCSSRWGMRLFPGELAFNPTSRLDSRNRQRHSLWG